MRADEPIGIHELNRMGTRKTARYINQLRVERLMAKAEMFNGGCYTRWCESKTKKNLDDYKDQYHRIGKAYEARAKRIKEGM